MNEAAIKAIGNAYAADDNIVALTIFSSHSKEPVYRSQAPPEVQTISTAKEVLRDGRSIGTIVVETSASALESTLRQFFWYSIAVALILSGVLIFGLNIFLHIFLGRPIKALGEWAEEVASGNYENPKASFNDTEIQTVAIKFTEMAHKVGEREKLLRESEQRFRDLADLLPQAVFEADREGTVTYTNRMGYELFGYSPEEVAADFNIATTITPGDRSRAFNNMTKRFNDEQIDSNEYKLCRIVFSTLTPREDGTVGLRGVIIDISERKAMETALQFTQFAMDHLADAAFFTKPDGRFIYVNDSACRRLGYSREELLEMAVFDIDPNISKQAWDEQWKQSQVGDTASRETRYRTKSGDYLSVEVAINRVEFDAEPYQCGIARDISVRKALEARLAQSQKLEAVGTLAGGISHDFNNLLQAISGYTELLLTNGDNSTEVTKNLGKIKSASASAGKLVQQILTFSRKKDAEKTQLNLNEEILRAVEMLERTIPKMITIETHLESELWQTLADSTQIEQVLMNLALNANDAMPHGGRLTLETSNYVYDQSAAGSKLLEENGDYVLFRISDTGTGMDQKTVARIFEPFFTTKEVGKGTGLGLSTAYGIIHSHGGQIYCYSEPGEGTSFSVYLPALPHDEAKGDAHKGKSSAEHPLEGGHERVLVVDDDILVRELAINALTAKGYDVVDVDSGEAALEHYQRALSANEHALRFDAVILDLGMPGMGGRRCLAELMALDPKAKVIVASGYSLAAQAKGVTEEGAKSYLNKPYKLFELTDALRKVLDED
jgi:PAS domain S-box-containing protein